MTLVERLELQQGFDTFKQLVDFGAATRITLEWKRGEHPTLAFVPTVALEYVEVSFTVADKDKPSD